MISAFICAMELPSDINLFKSSLRINIILLIFELFNYHRYMYSAGNSNSSNFPHHPTSNMWISIMPNSFGDPVVVLQKNLQ